MGLCHTPTAVTSVASSGVDFRRLIDGSKRGYDINSSHCSSAFSPFPSLNTRSARLLVSPSSSARPICPTNPFSKTSINSSSLEMHRSVCSCFAKCALTSFTSKTVAAPALYPAVMSSIESLPVINLISNFTSDRELLPTQP